MTKYDDRPAGHTRWWRLLAVLAPTMGAASVILGGVAYGAIPVSFTSASPFRVTVESLQSNGFALTPGVSSSTGTPAVLTSLSRAELTGLCQSQTVGLPVVGRVTVMLKAPTAQATNLVLEAYSASGTLNLQQLVIGPQQQQGIGYRSDHAVLENITIEAGSATAGTFSLNGVELTIHTGATPCQVPGR